jgi:hypothetical protein
VSQSPQLESTPAQFTQIRQFLGGIAYGRVSFASMTTATVGGVGTASISGAQTETGWVRFRRIDPALQRFGLHKYHA